MVEKNLNLIFYHYIHLKILENFNKTNVVAYHEVANFIANKFRIPRQIKKRVLWDLESMGLIHIIRGDVIKINESKKILSF